MVYSVSPTELSFYERTICQVGHATEKRVGVDWQQEVGGSLQLTVRRLAVTLPNAQEKHRGPTTHVPSWTREPGGLMSKVKLTDGAGIQKRPKF